MAAHNDSFCVAVENKGKLKMSETDILGKIAEKAVKQPLIALRMLRKLPHSPVKGELAIKSYILNRRRSGEQAALKSMQDALREEQ